MFVLLGACSNSTDEASGEVKKQSQIKNQKDDSTTVTDINSDTIVAEKEPENKNADESTTNKPNSLKAEYMGKLNDTDKEIVEMRENPIDDTTIASKKVEGDIYDLLDELINEIYGVLIDQLPSDAMDQLREEQREWLTYREKAAKEASLKYKNGTMEQLEYVIVENKLTEERCFQLVENYMN
ncbi:lysozyme inhibitor LprI family protein [Mesobacillus thioparans]|uniref:lysozyme inhibitor LprI family protein n=1 Tax=Mesobacillus thioparans TaxID=370439 RepID=UPI0039F00671